MAPSAWFFGLVLFASLGQMQGQQYPGFKDLDSNLYSSLVPAVCFRLTNATHQIGCSASMSSVQGNVWYVSTEEQLNLLLSGPAPHTPYVAFVGARDFSTQAILTNRTNLLKMRQSDRIVGVVIAHLTSNNTGTPHSSYSPLDSCDNSGFGWSGNDTCSVDWNPFHQGFFYHDFGDFPIMAITTENDYNTIHDCWSKFGQDNSYPLCSIEMKADMQVALDTETCFRRSNIPMHVFLGGGDRCDPIGDYSPWGTPFDLPEKNKSVVMVTAKLDSLSLFPYELSLGGGEVAGIVVLLAAAEAIGRLKREEKLTGTNSTIFFTLFHGESWDYIGSSKMVYDMERGDFKYFTPENITHFLELSHVGLKDDDTTQGTFFAHLNHDEGDVLINTLSQFASEEGLQLNQSRATALPPSSLLRFLRSKPTMMAAVLGDYDGGYINRFYGSRFDDINNIAPHIGGSKTFNDSLNATAVRLAALSTVVARTVLSLSSSQFKNGSNVSDATATASLVEDLIRCFLQNYSCSVFQEASIPDTKRNSAKLSRYTGVWNRNPQMANVETTVTQNLLSYYLGTRLHGYTKENCTIKGSPNYTSQEYFSGSSYNSSNPTSGVCVRSNTGRQVALSPAFSLNADGTISYLKERAGEYSSWAESKWSRTTLRVYITASVGHDVGIFFGGVCVFALSILISIQLCRKGRKVFL